MLNRGKVIFSVIIFAVCLMPFLVNPHSLAEFIYGGQLFLTHITHKVMSRYIILLSYFLIAVFFCMLIYYLTRKYINYSISLSEIKVNRINVTINFVLIFFIALIFKLIVYGFDINFFWGAQKIIDNYHKGVIFDVYKLYTYIAVLTSYIFSNYGFILGLLNLILSSLTISIFLLILFKINKSFVFNNFIILLVIAYMPLHAIDSLIRVDVLYLFLFTLSIYLTLRLTDNNNTKIILFLVVTMTLSCIAREQTIYLLPLYLTYIISLKMNNKIIAVASISFFVITTSFLLTNYNKNKYGMTSLFKNQILVFSAMQYGYLNPDIMASYRNELSDDARDLLKDIDKSYVRNVLPSKREAFTNPHPKLPVSWKYVRPDNLNVYDKANLNGIIDKNQFMLIKQDILANFDTDRKVLSLADVRNSMDKSIYMNDYHRDIANIESILINDFLYDGTSLRDYKKIVKECSVISDKVISSDCIKEVINGVSYDYYSTRHDIFYYVKAATEISSSYDYDSKKYIRHKNVDSITEVLLSDPLLYVMQSLLTITTMTGYVPIVLGMTANIQNAYLRNTLPDIFLHDFQTLYYFPVNFWYLNCLLLMLFTLFFHRDNSTRNLQLFFSLVPIYYGSFLAFATFAEFSRLMLPIIPFIIYNYIQLFRSAPIPMTLVVIFSYLMLIPG